MRTSWVSGLVERFIDIPLVWHVFAVLVVLVAGLGVTHPSEIWVSDEGAVRFQVELLATEGSWSAERPFADLDPEEITSPIHAATIVGDRYAPYTKHPLLPLLLVPLRNLAGDRALVLPALLGTIVAATMGALIAGEIERRIRNVTLWVLALGTPLMFYSYILLGHTLATALAGVALVIVIRFGERVSAWWLVAIVAVFLAVLLRTEAAAFGIALAVAVGVALTKASRITRAALSALLVVATMSAVVMDRLWAVSVGGAPPVAEREGVFVWFRFVSGFFSSTVLTDFGTPLVLVVVFSIAGGVALLVLTVDLEPGNLRLRRIVAGVSLAGSLALLVIIPEPIGGVLAATPILLAGLVSIRREHVDDFRVRFLLIVSVVSVVIVFATQERGGGGLQWGGRYLMLVLPAVVPVAILALRSLLVRRPFARILVVGVLAALTLTLSADALLTLRSWREYSAERTDDLSRLGGRIDAGGARPTIVSSDTHIGRHAWRTIEAIDYLLIPPDDFAEYVQRLADTGIEEFGVAGGWSKDRAAMFTSLGFEALDVADDPFIVVRRVGDDM